MSVRTNWIEAGFALINGAPTFITLADGLDLPHDVTITPAAGWKRSLTALPEADGDHHYRAPDFDTLVDSPIVLGNPAVYEFTVGGKKHYLVNEGEGGVFDGAKAAKDLETIVRENLKLWGSLPYDKYLFLNMITEAGGGLEHKNSTVLMTSRWTTRTRRAYLSWLDTASHELFHAWNVKRLRPVELGPFDYENENETRSLWIAEGVTEYYGALNLHRAGLSSREELLDSISNNIEELQTTPGRQLQSAEQASFDAWIKYYRPDENSAEHVDQLLHQGRGARVPARREDPEGDERSQEARRRDADGLPAVRRHARIFASGVQECCRGGCRDEPEIVLGNGDRRHRGTRLWRGPGDVRSSLPGVGAVAATMARHHHT